ncbi:unnamed protein product, partial [Musa acuminata subsp. burmannicoides]
GAPTTIVYDSLARTLGVGIIHGNFHQSLQISERLMDAGGGLIPDVFILSFILRRSGFQGERGWIRGDGKDWV